MSSITSAPLRPSRFLRPQPATRVSFVNAPTQPTVTVSRGAQFEVMVPQGYRLAMSAGAKQLSSLPLATPSVPGRGGRQSPAGEVQLVTLQANRTGSSGNLTFVKDQNLGRGGRPMAADVMSFPLVLKEAE